MDEHCPLGLELVLQALGHSTVLATRSPLAGLDDGTLVRRIGDVDCEWLVGMDIHREPEVWISVLSAVAEEKGRVLRIRPWRRRLAGPEQVAWLARFIVDGYDEWSRWLADRRIRMIDVGKAWTKGDDGHPRSTRGFTVHAVYSAADVGRLLQGELKGDGARMFPSKRPSRALVTQRGRRTARTRSDEAPPAVR